MRLADLGLAGVSDRLAADGLPLRCGTFRVRVRSRHPGVAAGLLELYADHPVDRSRDGFVDFEVEIQAPRAWRRWVRPQVIFSCDGRIPFKPLPGPQAMPMLEWGLNWVITSHAHDHLVLHAAVVERDDRALMLAADPGSGKSTLCAALVHRGWRLLSDELALVSLVDGWIQPIARPISLKNASIDIVRSLGPDVVVSQPCHDTAKGSVAHMRPPASSVAALDRPARPALLVFPKFSPGAALSSEPVGQGHSLVELTRHAFNASVLAGEGFDALARLIDAVQTHRIGYSSLDQVLPAIDRLWSQPMP